MTDHAIFRSAAPEATATTRRGVIALSAGAMASLGLRRYAGAQDAPASPTAGWSFTDDKNQTIELPAFPERLVIDVNAAAPLWDFGIKPVAVFGWNASEDGNFGPAGGRIDPTGIDVVGDVSEPIKIEELVAADPDLIITISWFPDDLTEFWSIDAEILPQVQAIAPVLAMGVAESAGDATNRFAELAAALGADLETEELAAQRERFEAGKAAVQEIAASKQDVQVLFLGVQDGSIYVANPPDWGDLTFYRDLGVNIIDPETDRWTWWETLSLEQALKYPADVLFVSTRPSAVQYDELIDIPTFAAHPAVQAGQTFGWNQDFILSHQGMADALEHLAASLAASEHLA